MKIVCVYHSVDLDGWMSAAIVKHWFKDRFQMNGLREQCDSSKDTLDFIGYNYGQPIPDLSGYDKVIMCDISFPEEEMFNIYMQKKYGNFIWLDHHVSAINVSLERDYEDTPGNRDTKFAACELTWEYFFSNETMPEIVRLLGRYDCFGHKGTTEEKKVLEFQYGARQCISNYEEAYNYLKQEILHNTPIENCEREENPIYKIWNNGKSIYQYLHTEAKQIYRNGFEIYFEPEYIPRRRKFICINKERFNPINFGIDYHKDDYDGAACFYFDGTSYNFSIYNDNGLVDCSVIAKQFGGGGHKGAAGFRLTKEQFIELIEK